MLSLCVIIRSDEGLTLKTSALKFFRVANLHFQLRWQNQIIYIFILLLIHSQEEENLKHEVAIKHQNAVMNYQRQLTRKDNQMALNR